jgi:hypothetical protein
MYRMNSVLKPPPATRILRVARFEAFDEVFDVLVVMAALMSVRFSRAAAPTLTELSVEVTRKSLRFIGIRLRVVRGDACRPAQ